MRIFAYVIVSAVGAAIIAMVVLNRGSERVVTTFLLGLFATLGALLALFYYGANEPIHLAFSSAIMTDAASHLPFEMLHGGFSNLPIEDLIFTRDELKRRPGLRDASDSQGMSLYHHALQMAIIGWFQVKYPKTWEVDLLPLTFGESRGYFFSGRTGPAQVYKTAEVAAKMAGNKFAGRRAPFGELGGLALPPGTDLKVTVPHADPQLGEIGTITLSNRYCTITIQTRAAGGQQGVGSYAFILGLPDLDPRLWTNQYTMIIHATFQRFLTGSPDMPRYKGWATDIAKGLQEQFDEQAVWSRVKDYYLLHGALPK